MEIFNETKNRYVITTLMLINRIYNGEILSENEFDELFQELSGDVNNSSWKFRNDMLKKSPENRGCNIFDFSDKSHVKLRINAPVSLLPCAAEKIWLKAALEDIHSGLFFNDDLKARLESGLQGVSSLNVKCEIKRERVNMDVVDSGLAQKLQTVLTAIHSKRELIYSNHTKNGDYIDKRAVPYKIEYSIAEDKLRVSMWSTDKECPIKANLSSMFDLSLGNEVTGRESIEEMVSRRLNSDPLCFIVTDKRGAVERALLTFTKYKRNIEKLEDSRYKFEITYYSFDENALISDILSFGPMIEVVSPQSVRDKVIERIRQGQTLVDLRQ